jgi:hypothetical protein
MIVYESEESRVKKELSGAGARNAVSKSPTVTVSWITSILRV